jgi:hypothetical protein
MKPVFQRIICNRRGDCLTAAVASLMELPYEQVPTWVPDAYDAGDETLWHNAYMKWLNDRGLFALTIEYRNLNDWRQLPGVFALASMPSQKFIGGMHTVVVTWEKTDDRGIRMIVAHDPNPENAKYADDVDPVRVTFICPMNPAAKAIKAWKRLVQKATGKKAIEGMVS